MMGRDQLNTVDPEHYTDDDNAEAPAEEMHILVEIDQPQDLDNASFKFSRVDHSGLPIIDPVGGNIEIAVARLTSLLDGAGALFLVR